MRLTESERKRILSLHNTERNEFILSENKFKLGRIKINKNKDGYYSLILNPKKLNFNPSKLKDTDLVFKLIKQTLSKEHPDLTARRIRFGKKTDKFGGRDVYRFAVLPNLSIPPEVETEIQQSLDTPVNQKETGTETITDVNVTTTNTTQSDGTTSTTTQPRANPEGCPLDWKDGTLKKGSYGRRVKILQLMLMDCGYDLPKAGADSDYGDETYGVVETYQKQNGLGVDGKAGEETIKSLCKCKNPERIDIWQDEKYELKNEVVVGDNCELEASKHFGESDVSRICNPKYNLARKLAFEAGYRYTYSTNSLVDTVNSGMNPSSNSSKLSPDAASAFKKLAGAIKTDLDVNLYVYSGIRDVKTQESIMKSSLSGKWDNESAIKSYLETRSFPGTSTHHTGRAADFCIEGGSKCLTQEGFKALKGRGGKSVYQWLLDNAGEHGFELTYPEGVTNKGAGFEPWHWEYVK